MKSRELNILKTDSKLNYDYQTIKITQSRIQKGLLAIPKAFSPFLPDSNRNIKVFLDDEKKYVIKTFSSAFSSTNENRIGGLKNWFEKNDIKVGDEILLQLVDPKQLVYRLTTEKRFIEKTHRLQNLFDNSIEDDIAESNINQLSNWLVIDKKEVFEREFLRLTNLKQKIKRRRRKLNTTLVKETAPANIRLIYEVVYNGLCQVCSFTFLKKNNRPYYEIHHLNPSYGHHPKNLVLVCANCHRQFEYANVETQFNDDGWLYEVKFNDVQFHINQAIHKFSKLEFKKTIYI